VKTKSSAENVRAGNPVFQNFKKVPDATIAKLITLFNDSGCFLDHYDDRRGHEMQEGNFFFVVNEKDRQVIVVPNDYSLESEKSHFSTMRGSPLDPEMIHNCGGISSSDLLHKINAYWIADHWSFLLYYGTPIPEDVQKLVQDFGTRTYVNSKALDVYIKVVSKRMKRIPWPVSIWLLPAVIVHKAREFIFGSKD